MNFTIEQLKLADELCFPADAARLFKKYFPDAWPSYLMDLKRPYEWNLPRWVFHWSRHDLEANDRELGNAIDAMIQELIGNQ